MFFVFLKFVKQRFVELKKKACLLKMVIIKIFIALVSEIPPKLEGLRILDQSSNSVTLLWTRPKTSINLPIISYELSIKDTKTNANWKEKILDGTKLRYVLKKLKPKSTYSISIFANNKLGPGEMSSFPIVETLEASVTPGILGNISTFQP